MMAYHSNWVRTLPGEAVVFPDNASPRPGVGAVGDPAVRSGIASSATTGAKQGPNKKRASAPAEHPQQARAVTKSVSFGELSLGKGVGADPRRASPHPIPPLQRPQAVPLGTLAWIDRMVARCSSS